MKELFKLKISTKVIFIASGIAATIWFLIRVIPKPSRAYYPCMRAAAPIMSSFVIYLLTLGGSFLAFRKAKQSFVTSKYLLVGLFIVAGLTTGGMYWIKSAKIVKAAELATGPADGANEPMGKAFGIYPGRVVWAWNPDVSMGNPDDASVSTFHFLPAYNDQEVYDSMLHQSVLKLTGTETIYNAWDKLFQYHNQQKGNGAVSYTEGEKIFIKLNQVSSSYTTDSTTAFSHVYANSWESWKIDYLAATQSSPYFVLAMLRQMVDEYGVDENDIYIGDPIGHIFKYNYEAWHNEFPDIHYVDKSTGNFGRTRVNATEDDLIFYSDNKAAMPDAGSDKLFDIYQEAAYMINVANLKPHKRAGFTGCTKNHFGSHGRGSAEHLHASLVAPEEGDKPEGATPENITNSGYGKYRVHVDIMGSKYLGGNTMLYLIDAVYGGGYDDNKKPVKWKTAPFNNDWCNSLFISQDPVAIESVCYDFLRTEYDGINQGYHTSPNWYGVDDYLHQAADSTNWPESIQYTPDGDGKVLSSLGVHEHWNNPIYKQYTKNINVNAPNSMGIELVSIPDTLVKYGLVSANTAQTAQITNLQVFPNPANTNANISFYTCESSSISVAIYSISGELIQNLYESNLVVPGEQRYTWNCSQQSSGLYLCRITLGTKVITEKFQVIN